MRSGRQRGTCPVVVAIPAKDEAEEIEGCLRALAEQDQRADAVVLCVNNTTDDSIARIERMAEQLPFALHVQDVALPPERAFAGVARGLAMDRAAELAGPLGVLLTTDADGRAARDWVGVNVAAIRDGADAVAGRAEIEPVGARLIPVHLHAIDARECAYAALLDEIAALVDPDPFDPWPRHEEHSGASIAVTVAAYRRAGGIPPVNLAEDRAFFDALRRVDARIRHALDAKVVVSARTVGRAPGGMADTMRRRMKQVDAFLDQRLEPAVDAFRRARVRAELRAAWAGCSCQPAFGRSRFDPLSPALDPTIPGGRGDRARPGHDEGNGQGKRGLPAAGPAEIDRLSRRLMLSRAVIEQMTAERYFGAAWARIERASPCLARRCVPLADLPVQTARARRLRDWLRAAAPLTQAAGPADMQARAAAD